MCHHCATMYTPSPTPSPYLGQASSRYNHVHSTFPQNPYPYYPNDIDTVPSQQPSKPPPFHDDWAFAHQQHLSQFQASPFGELHPALVSAPHPFPIQQSPRPFLSEQHLFETNRDLHQFDTTMAQSEEGFDRSAYQADDAVFEQDYTVGQTGRTYQQLRDTYYTTGSVGVGGPAINPHHSRLRDRRPCIHHKDPGECCSSSINAGRC